MNAIYLYLGFQALYLSTVFRSFPLVGDAADYASLISAGAFHIRSTHVGFYALYFPFVKLGQSLGIHGDLVANVLTTALAALTVAVVYLFIDSVLQEATQRNRIAVLAACFYGTAGLIWYHAEFAEVQSAMLLFLFLALLLFARGKHIPSGITLAVAVLISQACIAAGLWFAALALYRRIGWGKFARFAVAFIVALVLGIAPVYSDYMFGPRGVFPSHGYYMAAPIWKTLLNFQTTLLESFWLLLPLFLIPLRDLRKERELLWLTIASIPGFLYLGMKLAHIEYGFIWMPLYAIISAWLAIRFFSLTRLLQPKSRTLVAAIGVTAFAAATLFTYVLPKRTAAHQATACLPELAAEIGDGHALIGAHAGFAYAHYRWPDIADVTDTQWSMRVPTSKAHLVRLASKNPVYAVDYETQNHFTRTLLLSNPLSRAVIPERLRLQYLDVGERTSERVAEVAGRGSLEHVITCDQLSLWRVDAEKLSRGGD